MNALVGIRIDFPHARHHVQTDFVPLHLVLQVGTVGHIILMAFGQIVFNLLPADIEQRTHHFSVPILYAPQSADTGTAQQIQQHRFRVVLTVMGHGHTVQLPFLQQLLKEIIAQRAGCHLDADMMLVRIGMCGKTTPVQYNLPPLAEVRHKSLITVRLRTTQTEIAVRRLNLISQVLQHTSQGHRICSATESNQHRMLAPQQFMAGNTVLHFFLEIHRHYMFDETKIRPTLETP